MNTIAIEVPITLVTTPGKPTIGTWGATYRQKTTLRSAGPNENSGDWVQVQRMGNPLINEVIIGTGDKDKWSRAEPKDDAQFASYALDPLLAKVLNAVFGLSVPPAPRTDLLVLVQYLPVITGDPAIPKGPVADLLRLNTSIRATDAAARSRLGFLAGDNAGYPNGRRVSDDVTDISLRAVAGAIAGSPYLYRLGDGVNSKRCRISGDVPLRAVGAERAESPSCRPRRRRLQSEHRREVDREDSLSCELASSVARSFPCEFRSF